MKIFNYLPENFIKDIEDFYISDKNNYSFSYYNIKSIHIDFNSNSLIIYNNKSFIICGVSCDKVEQYKWDIKNINHILISFTDKSSISATDIFTLPWKGPLSINNIWEKIYAH